MKKVMILGAGTYQVPLIKKVQSLGMYAIVVSIPGDYKGFDCADKVYKVNTTDKEKVLEIAKAEQIDAIVTTGTDVAVSTVGYVASELDVHGIPIEAAYLATDKLKMKEAFAKAGVSTAEFVRVTNFEELQAGFNKIGAPAILKIVDKSGSRGITKIDSIDQLKEAFEYAKSASDAGYYILEKFISATEIGVDAFVQDGEIKLIIPHEKLVYHTQRTGIPMGHTVPMDMSADLSEKINDEMTKAIRALGLDDCAVNADVFVSDSGEINIIEVAGRCGATGIAEVISESLGIDYYGVILANALGEKVDFEIRKNLKYATSMLIFSEKTGTLSEINYTYGGKLYVNEELKIPGEITVSLDYAKGKKVLAVEDGTDRLGMVVIVSNSKEELEQKMKDFSAGLNVVVD